MKLNAYCIYDSAAGVYQRPFFVGADGEASRIFEDLVNEEGHPVNKHPDDYSLFRVGSFYDNTGEITKEAVPECLARGWEINSQFTTEFKKDEG